MPPELPEPALGINFARDGMQEKDWLALVAVHSDAWLLAVAFYFGARFGFDRADRCFFLPLPNDGGFEIGICSLLENMFLCRHAPLFPLLKHGIHLSDAICAFHYWVWTLVLWDTFMYLKL